MNDAMVEMTGTLAGLTLAMQNTRLIALSGLITGIAATLSMASSEYLSSKSEGRPDALKSASYTGVAYLVTVALLILPYLLFDESHYLWAMGTMVVIVLLILVVFNYYLSVAQDLPFKKRFGQMAGISLGVATDQYPQSTQAARGGAVVRHRHPGEAVPGRGYLSGAKRDSPLSRHS